MPLRTIASKAPQIITHYGQRFADDLIDPRFLLRTTDPVTMADASRTVDARRITKPQVSIADFEGRGYVSNQSDRTMAGGLLTKVNDENLRRPVDLRGGQDYMFDTQDRVWASAPGAITTIMNMADQLRIATKQDPLIFPFRMGPTGGDFSTMTLETMTSYAGRLPMRTQKRIDSYIKKNFIPDFKGIAHPQSLEQFAAMSGSERKLLEKQLDVQFRKDGGLSLPEARLSVTDEAQMDAPDFGLQNVGVIRPGRLSNDSLHPTYVDALPGEGIGELKEDLTVFDLDPMRALKENPRRSLEFSPARGIIDDKMLKRILGGGVIGTTTAAALTAPQAEAGEISDEDKAALYDETPSSVSRFWNTFQETIGGTRGLADTLLMGAAVVPSPLQIPAIAIEGGLLATDFVNYMMDEDSYPDQPSTRGRMNQERRF